jgi:hypothetical protein
MTGAPSRDTSSGISGITCDVSRAGAIALDGTDLCAWSNLALATQVGPSA